MADRTLPTETVTRKPDDDVGKPGRPPAGGGHQTPEQAAITQPGPEGRSDADRERSRRSSGDQPGHDPVGVGGSSGGHSDQKPAAGPHADKRVAQGHYKVERDQS